MASTNAGDAEYASLTGKSTIAQPAPEYSPLVNDITSPPFDSLNTSASSSPSKWPKVKIARVKRKSVGSSLKVLQQSAATPQSISSDQSTTRADIVVGRSEPFARRIKSKSPTSAKLSVSSEPTPSGLNAGSRLYRHALERRKQRERERREHEREALEMSTVRVSPHTSDLASTFWIRRIREISQSNDSEMSLNECLDCFDKMGLSIQGIDLKAFTSAVGGPSEIERDLSQMQISENDTTNTHSSKKVPISFEKLDSLIKASLDVVNENDEFKFSKELVESIHQMFTRPVKRAIPLIDLRRPKEEEKKISLRQFLARLEMEDRDMRDRRSHVVRRVKKEVEKEWTFKPTITPHPAGPPSSIEVHDRLFNEAEFRRRRLQEETRRHALDKIEKSLLECSFTPSVNALVDKSIVDVTALSVLDVDDGVRDHLDRMERARAEKKDKADRFEALGKTASSSPTKTTISQPRSPLAILDVILDDDERVEIKIYLGDDANAAADEMAAKYSLDELKREAVFLAVQKILEVA